MSSRALHLSHAPIARTVPASFTMSIRENLVLSRAASRVLATLSGPQRDAVLESIADALDANVSTILAHNAQDMARARESGMGEAMLDRLRLDPARVHVMAESVRDVASLADPLGELREMGTRPNGLRICKRRVPLGVLAVVYEARPNVTVECAALAIKSGNALVLRGGREALESNRALAKIVRDALAQAKAPMDAVLFIDDTSRERVAELLGATGLVDLCIPRGGASLMAMVDEHARVPVIRHGQGICHVFVDASAPREMAAAILVNAKTQRPGVCNAAETWLVHQAVLQDSGDAFAFIARALCDAGVTLHCDARAHAALTASKIACVPAEPEDWDREFLSLDLAVRVVDSLDEALAHIAKHGSEHTAAIVTGDPDAGERFLREVTASCVLLNASTRFNDGGQLGLGAEIGISTSRMHAWGPMGLRELTAEKFVVYGDGHTRP
ncbi:MAG: glutamate-5-semialdehyde dehydrogenase [Deltaproteobacteria bacterium]|nr:glutamate-5-semialdehyde dehydrogenase [Deltaproteobacteria bacterium]